MLVGCHAVHLLSSAVGEAGEGGIPYSLVAHCLVQLMSSVVSFEEKLGRGGSNPSRPFPCWSLARRNPKADAAFPLRTERGHRGGIPRN